ncbi:MAG: hypothetical protein KAR76_02655, partial [Methanosarcinales archaeon]|nr:hypothetical protein [Methanosarcinales archaeon]
MELEQEKKKIMMMVKVGTVMWIIGFLMVLSAITLEFTTYKPTLVNLHENPKQVWETATRGDNPDLVDQRIIANYMGPMLMTLKLGGIGFILSGIFMALVAIVNA